MTTLSDSARDFQMADMKSFDEPMPAIGIFWYDPKEHEFFGVCKKELTPKMVEESLQNGINVINYEKPDHCQGTHGRVAWNIDKFIVLVGKWAEDIQDELTALINRHFALPYFEFVYDEHWDLGHGWSGDV